MATDTNLVQQLINGTGEAFSIIQQIIANPTLTPRVNNILNPLQQVTLWCESYSEEMNTEVSQEMIVNVTSGVTWQTDNLAPRPRVWNMKGFLKSSIPLLEISAISPFLQPSLLQQAAFLRTIYDSREMCTFTTKYHQDTVLVAMSKCVLDEVPTIQNAIPFTITVTEIPVLNTNFEQGNNTAPSGVDNPAAAPASTANTPAVATTNPVGQ